MCGVVQVYEDDDRNVRKAGVDVLVQVYIRVGEQIWLYVQGLGDAKVSIRIDGSLLYFVLLYTMRALGAHFETYDEAPFKACGGDQG